MNKPESLRYGGGIGEKRQYEKKQMAGRSKAVSIGLALGARCGACRGYCVRLLEESRA
ncbi:MAG: hypothetical protein MI685_05135 [Chlorobiales bacterium]|nr:hypothetical protein [Chlorobiales bacterium]